MTDLRKLLEDASDLEGGRAIPLNDVLAGADRRLHRRRVLTVGVGLAAAAVLAAIVAITGIPGLHRADPDPVKDDQRDGIYIEERISPTEVERRCNVVLQRTLGKRPQQFVAGVDHSGRAIAADRSVEIIENRVGRTVVMAVPGWKVVDAPHGTDLGAGPDQVWCTIPQAGLLDVAGSAGSPGPIDTTNVKAVTDRCSRRSGYDLGGWTVLAATRVHGFLEAAFLSDNGYGLNCSVLEGRLTFYGERFQDDEGAPIVPADHPDDGRYDDLAPQCDPAGDSPALPATDEPERISCGAVGIIAGLPDGYRIKIGLSTGIEQVSTINRGGFAYAFDVADVDAKFQVTIRVVSPDGRLVWHRSFTRGSAPPSSGQLPPQAGTEVTAPDLP